MVKEQKEESLLVMMKIVPELLSRIIALENIVAATTATLFNSAKKFNFVSLKEEPKEENQEGETNV